MTDISHLASLAHALITITRPIHSHVCFKMEVDGSSSDSDQENELLVKEIESTENKVPYYTINSYLLYIPFPDHRSVLIRTVMMITFN